ncbi:MAG: rod shape-determining protein [Candidatus Kuenenbacteria bacterium]
MLNKFFGYFSKDMAIDLGTSNTLVYIKDRGIVINEPSVVAINTRTDQILAVGEEAKKMIGRTPSHIIASNPLSNGVISDFEVAEKMLKYFIDKVHQEKFTLIPRPRMIINIPLEITEVEKKAVEDAAIQAGAREVFLIEGPMADAIGSRIQVKEASGNMIVNIGGGTTEIAVISLGGVVTWKSLLIAGNEFNKNIINYVREKFNLLLGECTAEEIKIKMGSIFFPQGQKEKELPKPLERKIRGRDLITGLPKEISITNAEIQESLIRSAKLIVEAIKDTLENTPPELVSDIYKKGIILTGGSALLQGFDKLISQQIQIPVYITDDPLTCVVRGIGILLEDPVLLKDIVIPAKQTPVKII